MTVQNFLIGSLKLDQNYESGSKSVSVCRGQTLIAGQPVTLLVHRVALRQVPPPPIILLYHCISVQECVTDLTNIPTPYIGLGFTSDWSQRKEILFSARYRKTSSLQRGKLEFRLLNDTVSTSRLFSVAIITSFVTQFTKNLNR